VYDAPGHPVDSQNDSPYLRPDNEPSSIHWTKVTLDLPTR
jgi:hypothetical protein